jgi:hypothetical protein
VTPREETREKAIDAAAESANTAGIANRAGARTSPANTGSRINQAYGGSYRNCVPRNPGFGPRLHKNRNALANK